MSDINAAPSSTEPRIDPNAGAPIESLAPVEREAGAATAGKSVPSAATVANVTAAADVSVTSQASAPNLGGDAPAVATSGEPSTNADSPSSSGEAGNGVASAATATSTSNAAASADAGTAAADDPNAGASPAADPSASDIASSAPPASQGDDTEADALRSEIASLEQQLTDAHAEIAKWQGLYNAATEAKPHAQSLLQKLEAGEAIVLGDLQAKLRALVKVL